VPAPFALVPLAPSAPISEESRLPAVLSFGDFPSPHLGISRQYPSLDNPIFLAVPPQLVSFVGDDHDNIAAPYN
jgi:hypothetical protein